MTLFDMSQYLLGDGRVYTLIGKYPDGRTTHEVCQTQMVSPVLGWQVKNENGEEIGFTAGYIRRGTDFSMSEEQYYQLWTPNGGKLGTRWCPRFWRLNDPYKREVEVRTFKKGTNQPVKQYIDITWLEAMTHYPTWQSPSGLSVPDVLELTWYTNPALKLERYRYARGIGLVGYENLTGMTFKSYIGEFLPANQAPKRKVWPGVAAMVVPVQTKAAPALPNKEDAMWKPHTLISVSGQFLRTNTKIDGEFVGAVLNGGEPIPDGAAIMVMTEPFHFDEENGQTWYGVQYGDEVGWMALRKGAQFEDQFKAVVSEPPPALPQWTRARLILPNRPDDTPDSSRVRREPDGEQVASIQSGAVCFIDKTRLQKGKAHWWIYAKNQHEVEGWVALLNAPLGEAVSDEAIAKQFVAESETNPPPTADPKEQILIHVALTQLRAMMLRKVFVQEEQARLDKEAQGLMTDIITMTNILESLNVNLPDWAVS